MKSDECPSCHARHVSPLASVPSAQVIAGYAAANLGMDVAALFEGAGPSVALLQCDACGLKWYAHGPAGDAAFYVSLQRHPWYYENDKSEYGFARRQIPANSRVLEVGCGRGAFRSHLDASVKYRGLEFNQSAVDQARAEGLDVEIRDIKVEADTQSAQYDVVCHFQVLEHVDDPAAFMRDCARALRPGGRLLVAVPAEDSFIGLAESTWLNMPPHHLTRWTDAALRTAFAQVSVEPGELWHEEVSAIHKSWHRNVLVNAGWLSLTGRSPGLVGGQPPLLLRLARRVPAVREALVRRALKEYPHAARGHTLCLVGVKR